MLSLYKAHNVQHVVTLHGTQRPACCHSTWHTTSSMLSLYMAHIYYSKKPCVFFRDQECIHSINCEVHNCTVRCGNYTFAIMTTDYQHYTYVYKYECMYSTGWFWRTSDCERVSGWYRLVVRKALHTGTLPRGVHKSSALRWLDQDCHRHEANLLKIPKVSCVSEVAVGENMAVALSAFFPQKFRNTVSTIQNIARKIIK
jgi:hypothetical protein